MNQARFYHAGCPVCQEAENTLADAIDRNRYQVEIVHLGSDKTRLNEAKAAGVESVPALVLDGAVLHINHGAGIEEI